MSKEAVERSMAEFQAKRAEIEHRGRVYDLTLDVIAEDAGVPLDPPAPSNDRERAEFLFNLLGDIDTLGDIAKSDDAGYRAAVERIQARRWESGIRTDGYRLYFPGEPMPESDQVPREQPRELSQPGGPTDSRKSDLLGRGSGPRGG